MTGRSSKRKGSAGERQFCRWLWDYLEIDAERNLSQTRDGGADIITADFIFEVKRVENLNLANAWRQVAISSKAINKKRRERGESVAEPVLAHRVNNSPWSFCISAKHIGLNNGFIMLNERNFLEWAKLTMEITDDS